MKTFCVEERALPLVESGIQLKKWGMEHRLNEYQKRLKDFEAKHSLSTEEFKKRFAEGVLGDDREWFCWLNTIELFRKCEEGLRLLKGIHLGFKNGKVFLQGCP